MIALDPGLLAPGGTDAFQEAVEKLVLCVKGAQPLPGVQEVMVPGERSGGTAGECRGAFCWVYLLGVPGWLTAPTGLSK